MKDSRQIRATRGYLSRLLTKRERKQAKVLIRFTHTMVGSSLQRCFKERLYVTR